MKIFIITLMLTFAVSAGLSQKSAEQGKAKTTSEQSKAGYTCPMHPKVTSDKPGQCPECGMNLVANKMEVVKDGQMKGINATSEKINKAKSLLKSAKGDLAQAGKYNCCVEHPCDRCIIDHGSCSCGQAVKDGKPVCSDCYAGWERGEGIVKGVDKKKVKMDGHSHNPDH